MSINHSDQTTAGEVGASVPTVHVVIIDDHELFSTSLMIALRDCGFEARKVSAARLPEFAAQAPGAQPGLVVLDLHLGNGPDGRLVRGCDWVAAIGKIGWQVLAVTGTEDQGEWAAVIAEGAVGVVSKSSPLDVLLNAVMLSASGVPLLTPDERREWVALHEVCREQQRRLDGCLARLTTREREVLELIAHGRHAAEIAKHFVVALATVRTQIRSILTKLEVNSQLEAVALISHHLGER